MLVGRGTRCRRLLALQEVQLWDFLIPKSHLQTLSQRKNNLFGTSGFDFVLKNKSFFCTKALHFPQAFAMDDVTESYL